MSDEEGSAAIAGAFLASVLWVIIILCIFGAHSTTTDEWRAKAVSLGAAEWVVNQKDGTTTFKWKETAEK